MTLDGKTFVVVGAGLLGNTIVKGILEQGGNVAIVDYKESALKELQSLSEERLIARTGDITSTESVEHIILAAVERFGAVDGAVNTAYPRNPNYGRSFFDVTYEDFCENVSSHMGGYFLFMQQCAKYAIDQDIEFSLVNMSSIYGVIAPRFEIYTNTSMTMPVEYAAIKSGLQHLTAYLTAYSKGSKFRVNCVSPGGILAGQDPAFLDQYNRHTRYKGMLDATDIVGAVVFLLSDASKYICGQNIIVDDGFCI